MRTVTRRCIQNEEDGTHHGDRRLANSLTKKSPMGQREDAAHSGMGTDRQTGIFAGDAGGRELGSAEL